MFSGNVFLADDIFIDFLRLIPKFSLFGSFKLCTILSNKLSIFVLLLFLHLYCICISFLFRNKDFANYSNLV